MTSDPSSAVAEDLLVTCWTTAGDAASDRPDLRSPLPVRDRIEAAAAAGFTGFGLLSDDLPGMVTAPRTAGWNGPWGVEILSDEHRSLPLAVALHRSVTGARGTLEQARGRAAG